MANRVGSGDPANAEAYGARHYWNRLFQDFRRHEGGDLGLECRRAMSAIASESFVFDGEQLTLQAVADRMANDLVKVFQQGRADRLRLHEM